MKTLLQKYNVAAPRYTSYPTVPYWQTTEFTAAKWQENLKAAYANQNGEGISLYIHLPFCESLCTYCGCNTRITKNHGVESPYIDALIKEWQMYVSLLGETPKVKELHLGGGTPTFFSPQNLEKLIVALVGENNNNVDFSFEGHPDNTTAAHLQLLGKLGFKRLSLGIQDFDPKVQFMINRFQTPEQVKNITLAARKEGYQSINFDLIYGLPGQTLSGLEQTITEVVKLMPERIAFYSYAHVPWLKPGQRHFGMEDIPQGAKKFALYELGKKMLLDAGYQEIGMDHFALKNDNLFIAAENEELHRNFMGYTDCNTAILIGLGVSSISDCQTAFAQNAKTVEAYLQQINAGELALEKGHILSANDSYIRQHILNIMCKGKTSFENGIPDEILARLQPMLEDGIAVIDGDSLKITKIGKSFLRNVCMAFDERLWEKCPTQELFSTAL